MLSLRAYYVKPLLAEGEVEAFAVVMRVRRIAYVHCVY